MNLTINGKARKCDAPLTVAELIATLQLDADRVAVEHNRVVLLNWDFATTPLNDGDVLEIVQFVGGG